MKKLLAFIGSAVLIGSGSSLAQTVRPVPPPAVHIERTLSEAQKGERSTLGGVLPAQVYSHGNPTAEEQYILELINRARANPKAEGDTLANTKDAEVVGSYNYFGTPTPAQVRSDFQVYPVQPPLAFNANLIAAARKHSQDMLDHNFQSHTGSDNSTFDQRMNTAGYTGWTGAGENIYAYGKTLFSIHAIFQIDFGNANLGHRQNIMNFTGAVFREVGIGLLHGGTGLPNVGPMITTEDFGVRPDETFLTGVVYDDKNKNGFYDIGEGLSGVTITATGTTWTTVTSSSGGYALPYTTNGTVKVTATGTGLPSAISRTVTFSGDNVKVDFTPAMGGAPGPVVLVLPTPNGLVKAVSTKLTWRKITAATKYQVQFGLDTIVANMLINDSTLTDSTKTVNNLLDGVQYFWRVRAKNSSGWGEWSAFANFTVALPASKVTLVKPVNGATTTEKRLLWNAATPNVSHYRVEVYPNGSLVNAIVNDSTITDTAYTFSVPLASNITYYWRVTAQNGAGWGTPSDVHTFTFKELSVGEDIGTTFSVTARSTQTGINFRIDGAAEPSWIELFDETGKSLANESTRGTDVTIDAGSLTPGVYFYRVTSARHLATGRVLVTGTR